MWMSMVSKGVMLGIIPQKLLPQICDCKSHAFGFIFSRLEECFEYTLFDKMKANTGSWNEGTALKSVKSESKKNILVNSNRFRYFFVPTHETLRSIKTKRFYSTTPQRNIRFRMASSRKTLRPQSHKTMLTCIRLRWEDRSSWQF